MRVVNNGLQIREQAYRSASRAFDNFVTGLSSVLFLATAFTYEAGQPRIFSTFNAAAIILFALAVIAGLKKLEYSVVILGADYTVGLTEADQANLTVRESTAVVRDLNETIERLSGRASAAHAFRNWMLVLGVIAVTLSRIFHTFIA